MDAMSHGEKLALDAVREAEAFLKHYRIRLPRFDLSADIKLLPIVIITVIVPFTGKRAFKIEN